MVNKLIGKFLLFLINVLSLDAQQVVDYQVRPIGHGQYDLNKNWFLAGWMIGNGQYYGNNNINLLGGVGYRSEGLADSWWLESMIQRQWAENSRKLLWDNRFQYSSNNTTFLYVEVAPFLNKGNRGATYDMIVLERATWRKLNCGIETENVHKIGRDSLGIGPRVSIPLGFIGSIKVSAAVAYQFRRDEIDALRFYLVFNKRLKKH